MVNWAWQIQGPEIARLLKENEQLEAEIERKTGRPIQLTPAKRRTLTEKGKRLDPKVLKKVSVFEQEQYDSAEK